MSSVYNKTVLQMCCGSRAFSDDDYATVGMMSIDILVNEKIHIYDMMISDPFF